MYLCCTIFFWNIGAYIHCVHYVTCYTHSLMLLVFINHICLSALHKATLHYWLIDWLITFHAASYIWSCHFSLSWVWVRLLHCSLIPCLNKDILCHVWPYSFLCLQITRSDIGPHIKWDVSRVIADDHLVLLRGLCGYVLITCMGTLSTLYHLNHFVLIQIFSIPSWSVNMLLHSLFVNRIFSMIGTMT